jgi:uncharacterized protein
MRINEVDFTNARPFDSYGDGGFRLDDTRYDGNLIVSDGGIVPWAGYEDLAPLLALKEQVDVILVGTGAEMGFVPTEMRVALESAGMGVEPMATSSACRTYNVLLAEGRRVAAAVLAI